MNALDMRHNRIPYLLAFGAVVHSVTAIIFNPETPFSDALLATSMKSQFLDRTACFHCYSK